MEGDKHGVGPAIPVIWKNYVQNITKEFNQDQQQNSESVSLMSLCPSLSYSMEHMMTANASLIVTILQKSLRLLVAIM